MSTNVIKIRLFVASPGDVSDERNSLSKVIAELNSTIAPDKGFLLEIARWETHCQPAMGRPQGVINSQIGHYDIFIGIMWKRFGTPTGVAESGTEEEFRLAYSSWSTQNLPWIMFYFCQYPFMPRRQEEIDQLSKVLKFREELQGKGLIWEYPSADEFSDIFRPHLVRILLDMAQGNSGSEPPETPPAPQTPSPKKPIIYLAYGRDQGVGHRVREFLEKLGCSVISLRYEADAGRTLIEKFHETIKKASAAVVILSADEILEDRNRSPMPSQNVIFELGLLQGILGRDRTYVLSESNVKLPSDMLGSIYINYGVDRLESSYEILRKELINSGLIRQQNTEQGH